MESFYRKYVFKDIIHDDVHEPHRTFTAKSQAREHFYVEFKKSIWSRTEGHLRTLDGLLLAASPTAILIYFGLYTLAGIVGTATVFGIYILYIMAGAAGSLWR